MLERVKNISFANILCLGVKFMNEYLEPFSMTMDSKLKKLEGYTVYADESNNMRKVRIKDSTKDDLKYKFFVIGGIITPDYCDLNKIKDLYDKSDGFPENEVKYKFFSHNKTNIEDALSKDRFYALFDFLIKNGIYIHLNVFNYWYYAIADIVDSLYVNERFDINDNFILKTGMYEGLIIYYDEMYELFKKYEFPNIPKMHEKEFVLKLRGILSKSLSYNFNEGDELYEPIKHAIELIDKNIDSIEELIFIQDETPLEITDSLLSVYVQSAYAFKLNGIIFDNEKYIESQMIDQSIKDELNCKFIDSKENIAIQISDVIAGFAARYYEMVVNENRVEKFCDKLETRSTEMQTIKKFQELLTLSQIKYCLTHISIMSDHELATIKRFNGILSMFA